MRIIDKNKDFYDYFQDYDSDVVFDRRNSYIITKDDICRLMDKYSWEYKDGDCLLLQIGYTNWLILLKATIDEKTDMITDYSVELVEKWKDYNKSVDFKFGKIKTLFSIEQLYSKKWQNRKFMDDVKLGNFEYTKDFTEKSLIILNKTKLPSILDAQEVYMAIEEWLSHKKDEIVHDNMTDKEKIVSHGFDTKSSFRGK